MKRNYQYRQKPDKYQEYRNTSPVHPIIYLGTATMLYLALVYWITHA